SARKYELIAIWDSVSGIKDLFGNMIQDTMKSKVFPGTSAPDTVKPALLSQALKDSTRNVLLNQILFFQFNDAVEKNKVESKIIFKALKGNKDKKTDKIWLSDNFLLLKPLEPLEDDSWYELDFNSGSVLNLSGNAMKDSVYKCHFQTEDTRGYGGLKGKITDSLKINGNAPDCPGTNYILTLYSKQTPRKWTVAADLNYKWEFSGIPAGDYKMEAFVDANGNGKYDYGDYFPFKFAERFQVFDNEFAVKARWTVDDINLIMK
ncbi:MAG: hypothetical protein QG635_253, partial [Bacteroidota bacterium]|nr:hypothetical protein [Bacteroidota bacterium]